MYLNKIHISKYTKDLKSFQIVNFRLPIQLHKFIVQRKTKLEKQKKRVLLNSILLLLYTLVYRGYILYINAVI